MLRVLVPSAFFFLAVTSSCMAGLPIPQNQMLNLAQHGCSINSWISKRTPINSASVVKPAVPADVLISTWQHPRRPACLPAMGVYTLELERACRADCKGLVCLKYT